ncbi:MAG: hypothetical protein ACJ71Q_09035 [Terriglobales bacterium]
MATGSIIPPAGFVLENQPAQNQPEPNQNTITPPAGFQLEDSSAPTGAAPQSQTQPSLLSRAKNAWMDAANSDSNPQTSGLDAPHGLSEGAGKGLTETLGGISHLFGGPAATPAETQTSNFSEGLGKLGESITEWIGGEEGLKGLSLAERFGMATKLAKMAKSHPAIEKLLTAGLSAVKNFSLGTGQAALHGATPSEALKAGAVAGGTGLALEGVGNVVKSLAPTTEKIAGTEIPVRASSESKLADAAESVSRSKPLQKFDVEQTQPGARKAIGNVATDVKNAATPKFANGNGGTDTQAFKDAVMEISPGKSFADLNGPEQSKVLARAQELKTARNGLSAASKATDFGDAADQVRAQAKPVYEKLDTLTKDQEMTFSDLQRAERSAFNKGDFDAVTKYQREQDKIFETYKDQFSDPDAYQNARRMWRQASALDKIHDTVTAKGVMESTPNGLIPKGAPDPRYIKAKQFTDTILHLRDTGLLKDAGLTPQHVQDLQDIGRLLRKSGEIQNTNQLMKVLKVGTKIAVGGPATAGVGYGASAVLGKIMTDPKAAATAVKVLQSSAFPAAAANLYCQAASALGGPAAIRQQ